MSKQGRIPFEPNSNKKAKEPKKTASPPVAKPVVKQNADKKTTVVSKSSSPSSNQSNTKKSSQDSLGIPEEVNRRIIRRAALFCGIPTSLGIGTFIASYIVVSRHIFDLPTSAVVLVSMLFLGIGVLGLSYGAISASWDVGRVGTWWGSDEFKKNFGYLKEAWKSQQQMSRAAKSSKNS